MNYIKRLSALITVISLVVLSSIVPMANADADVTVHFKDAVVYDDSTVLIPPDTIDTDEDFNDLIFVPETIELDETQQDDVLQHEHIEEEMPKLYELVDLWNFKPSYNLVVTHALVRVGEQKDRFVDWCQTQKGTAVLDDSWSLIFLNWCSTQAKMTTAIPIYNELDELENFFRSNERFYRDGTACLPKIGDLILLDDDGDKIADRVNIVSYYDSGVAVIESVGGCIWSNSDCAYTVQEEKHGIQDKAIVGICRPDYGLKQDVTFSDPEIIFNAVDTVSYLREPEYAQVLADNGIEVIARYINPEGRTPLDIAEAQRYSDAGVRIMMIYQIGTSDPYKGYDTGYLFGTRALEYARKLQAPKGTPIFFCCDCACDIRNFDKVAQFIMGVKDAMQGEYGVGLYGGYFVNEAMFNLGLIDAHWQSLGFNSGYLSPNMDMFQSSSSTPWFSEIPTVFDSNYVKNPEKVSYIMPKIN